MSRFIELRCENGDFLVVDLQQRLVLCRCTGYKAPLNAEYLCEALESFHSRLMDALCQPLVNHETGPQPPRNGSGREQG